MEILDVLLLTVSVILLPLLIFVIHLGRRFGNLIEKVDLIEKSLNQTDFLNPKSREIIEFQTKISILEERTSTRKVA